MALEAEFIKIKRCSYISLNKLLNAKCRSVWKCEVLGCYRHKRTCKFLQAFSSQTLQAFTWKITKKLVLGLLAKRVEKKLLLKFYWDSTPLSLLWKKYFHFQRTEEQNLLPWKTGGNLLEIYAVFKINYLKYKNATIKWKEWIRCARQTNITNTKQVYTVKME